MLARISAEQRIVDAVYHHDHGGEEPDDDGKSDGIVVAAVGQSRRRRVQVIDGYCAVSARFDACYWALRQVDSAAKAEDGDFECH